MNFKCIVNILLTLATEKEKRAVVRIVIDLVSKLIVKWSPGTHDGPIWTYLENTLVLVDMIYR